MKTKNQNDKKEKGGNSPKTIAALFTYNGGDMSDYTEDAKRDKWLEEKEAIHQAHRDYCYNDCEYHNGKCLYYDPEEECWDYEECFKDSGGWE